MTARIDQPVVGDGEDPGAEATFLALEPGDVARDLKEDLAEDILRIGRPVGAQVSEDLLHADVARLVAREACPRGTAR